MGEAAKNHKGTLSDMFLLKDPEYYGDLILRKSFVEFVHNMLERFSIECR